MYIHLWGFYHIPSPHTLRPFLQEDRYTAKSILWLIYIGIYQSFDWYIQVLITGNTKEEQQQSLSTKKDYPKCYQKKKKKLPMWHRRERKLFTFCSRNNYADVHIFAFLFCHCLTFALPRGKTLATDKLFTLCQMTLIK